MHFMWCVFIYEVELEILRQEQSQKPKKKEDNNTTATCFCIFFITRMLVTTCDLRFNLGMLFGLQNGRISILEQKR